MNESYLMRHVSYHLHTIVRKYSPAGKLSEEFCGQQGFSDHPLNEWIMILFASLDEYQNAPTFPLLLRVNEYFVYALVPASHCYYLIGPMKFHDTIYLRYHAQAEAMSSEQEAAVPVCEFSAVTTDLLLIYNLYHSDTLTESDLHLHNCINPDTDDKVQKHYSELVFENQEEGRVHNPYDQEQREFSSIERGDLDQLKRSIEEDYAGEIGTLAKDPLRHAKNLGIVNITLASRAAIRGGLISEISYSLSDSYIQKVEEATDIPSVHHLFRSAEFEYAQMVRDINEHKENSRDKGINYNISRCKDYVFHHLHEPIRVQDIAEELGLNANYLSELFHRCENVTLSGFILNEKIKLTRNLLIYSQYSYSEIAAYLGFSSQSHLGKQFKRHTHMTLRQYREMYGLKEFHN